MRKNNQGRWPWLEYLAPLVLTSEVQLRTELELSRIERRCRLAVVLAAGPLAPRVDNVVERVRRCLVEAVEQIESLGDQVEADTFTESDPSRQTCIYRKVIVGDAPVAAEVTICREYTLEAVRVNPGLTQGSVGQNSGPLIRALEITVCVADGQDVEGPTGTIFNDRRKREALEEPPPAAARTPAVRRAEDTAEHKPVALIEQ